MACEHIEFLTGDMLSLESKIKQLAVKISRDSTENRVCLECFLERDDHENETESEEHSVYFCIPNKTISCVRCDGELVLKPTELDLSTIFQFCQEEDVDTMREQKQAPPLEDAQACPEGQEAKSIQQTEKVDLSARALQFAKDLSSGKFKSIVILSGAGTSTAAGVPDFRSPGTGLYDNLQKYNLADPTDVFDISFFRKNPEPFYQLSKELYDQDIQPTFAHRFFALLQRKGFLRRLYSQNIDGLDRKAGVSAERLVEAHGSYGSASCISCKKSESVDKVTEMMLADQVPKCERCGAFVKPDIVFFGEALPKRFEDLNDDDMSHCDCLIVIGTSLSVYPVAALARMANPKVPRVLINREIVGNFSSSRDVVLLGNIEDSVIALVIACGWMEEMDRPTNQTQE